MFDEKPISKNTLKNLQYCMENYKVFCGTIKIIPDISLEDRLFLLQAHQIYLGESALVTRLIYEIQQQIIHILQNMKVKDA